MKFEKRVICAKKIFETDFWDRLGGLALPLNDRGWLKTILLNLSVRRTSRKLTMNFRRNTIPISTQNRMQNLSRGFTQSQRHMTSWVTPGSVANTTRAPLLDRPVNVMTTSWSSTNTRAKSSCRNGVKPRIGTLGKALTAQSGTVNNAI